jgi:hypothetical protein
MMEQKATKGPCSLCGKEYTRAGMGKHLASCLMNRIGETEGNLTLCYHLLVTTKYRSGYWLHLQIDANATLKTLDGFLRRIWLECCDHMSSFYMGKHTIGKSRQVGSILEPGMEVDYDYDMGDTTSLRIKVLDEYPGLVNKKKQVEVLARNQPPKIPCDECNQHPAVFICSERSYEGEGWLCAACVKQQEGFDEEDYFSIPNSPRAGVCGYTGE